ncbi:MAG: UDP-N-acetylmuramoyl-tripeptide--D-alanyl-D-alanine ligase [Gammaproteobacteria bacterium]|jgi:UDP-N-acetylmuramoyl-tripeptide--D-alanyl-D-alanine ligase|nr:UDP-N-acetylmuramoyl-tripeptide--D-alanyl-D-alanine ligase [Gammaproteobacteria bacterium]MBT7603052.1 UDP-N-acetylmuramoyl-tripeptide--D-alanyl-D-alanine ligase [Gammaproteobacteria bacterium]
MVNYSLKEIAEYIGGDFHGNDASVTGFSIDSRTINTDDVFFCIKGKNFDGHDFIKHCAKKASCIITSNKIEDYDVEIKSYIYVSDTLSALQKASEFVRKKSKAKFIAITGSNGKTTVKEMIAHILSDYKITYTKANSNNHIGVPLTLLSINQDDDYIILEIGSNHPGEIAPLAKIINPDIAVVTNVGYAHIEGFRNLKNIAKEKYSIYQYIKKNGIAIINNEDKYKSIIKTECKKIYFGHKLKIYLKILQIFKNTFKNYKFLSILKIGKKKIELNYGNIKENININLNGEHNHLNVACAASIALSLKIDIRIIRAKIESFNAVPSRLKLHQLDSNVCIIDDCYNANPSSFKAALSYLSEQDQKKLVLMGDMVELGKDSEFFHKEIGSYARSLGINKFLSIGKFSKYSSDAFGNDGYHFENSESLKSFLNNEIDSNLYILIKGSRSTQLEEYVDFIINGRYV